MQELSSHEEQTGKKMHATATLQKKKAKRGTLVIGFDRMDMIIKEMLV